MTKVAFQRGPARPRSAPGHRTDPVIRTLDPRWEFESSQLPVKVQYS